MSYVFAARIHLTSEKRKQNRLTVDETVLKRSGLPLIVTV